jgi:hypothetical protein
LNDDDEEEDIIPEPREARKAKPAKNTKKPKGDIYFLG